MARRRLGGRAAALSAVLGLVAGTLALVVTPAAPVGAVDEQGIDETQLSGTLPNGVSWEANGPPNAFGPTAPSTRTITFSEPVHLEFSISMDCQAAPVQLPPEAEPLSLDFAHVWDPVDHTLVSLDGSLPESTSRFTIPGLVDELTVAAITSFSCDRRLVDVVASVPEPFDCDVSTVFLAQGTPATQLNVLEYGGGEGTFVPLGDPRIPRFNGIAYHPERDLIYATDSLGHVIVIDSAGEAIDLGPPTPAIGITHNSGAIGPDGRLYTMFGPDRVLDRIDLDTLANEPLALSTGPESADFTLLGGSLWGFDASPDAFVRVDPVTGQVDKFETDLLDSPIGVGAAWTFANGNLGLSDNETGTIYQVAITDPDGPAPTFQLVSAAPGPASNFNDGTACEGPPTDLSLEKSVDPDLLVGDTALTWTLTVRNEGPSPSSGYVVTDTLPAEVTDVATDTPGCVVEGQVVTCTGAGLGVGEERVVVVTGTAPAGVGSVTNGAVLTPYEEDPDLSNNEAQATAGRAAGLCAARALGLPLGIDLSRANPAESPCQDDGEAVLRLDATFGTTVPPISLLANRVELGVVVATSEQEPTGHSAAAAVATASIRVPALALAIDAEALHSSVSASLTSCAAPPTLTSTSRLATVTINGLTIPVGDLQLSIPLLVGALHLNQAVVTGGTIVRRTLFLDLPGTALDVVIGESKAGITC